MTPPPNPQLQLTGHVQGAAQVRNRILDHEVHTVPVLVIEVECDGPLRLQVRIEQNFAADDHAGAEAAARRYKRGTRLRFDVPPFGMRLIATGVTHIERLADMPPQASAAQEAEPELFA